MSVFNQQFKKYISALRIIAPGCSYNAPQGETPSSQAGESLDFYDYRAYVPGDDLRRIDWNIYSRYKKLFLRRFRHYSQSKYSIFLDISPAMYFETERLHSALRISAALGSAVLNQRDRLKICVSGISSWEFKSGQSSIPFMLQQLEKIIKKPIATSTNKNVWHRLQQEKHETAWLVSDFFSSGGIDSLDKQMNKYCGRFYPLRIFKQNDESPQLNGSLNLVDCTGVNSVKVNISPAVLKAYKERYKNFKQIIDEFAKRNSSFHYSINADLTWHEQLKHLFPDGILNLGR